MFQSAKLASLLPRLPGDSEQKKAKAAEAKAVNEVIGAVMAMEMWRYAFFFCKSMGFQVFFAETWENWSLLYLDDLFSRGNPAPKSSSIFSGKRNSDSPRCA